MLFQKLQFVMRLRSFPQWKTEHSVLENLYHSLFSSGEALHEGLHETFHGFLSVSREWHRHAPPLRRHKSDFLKFLPYRRGCVHGQMLERKQINIIKHFLPTVDPYSAGLCPVSPLSVDCRPPVADWWVNSWTSLSLRLVTYATFSLFKEVTGGIPQVLQSETTYVGTPHLVLFVFWDP